MRVPNRINATARTEAIVQKGYQLARFNGVEKPLLQDAIWALLVEMVDTLRRMPNQERRWLVNSLRSRHPATLCSQAESFANAVANGAWAEIKLAMGPPSPEAISRLDDVLTWPSLIKSKRRQRDIAVLLGTAAGIPPRVFRAQYGVTNSTVYDIKKRCLVQIALELGLRPAKT
jgi:hypothetical protein